VAEGKLIIEREPDRHRIARCPEPDFGELPTDRKAAAKRRLYYLSGLERMGIVVLKKALVTRAVAQLAHAVGDDPPSYPSICRWRNRAGHHNKLRRLIDRRELKGNRTSRFSPEVLAIMDGVIEERYLTPERTPVTEVYPHLCREIADLNRLRPSHDQLPIPSIHALYRRIHGLDRREVKAARYSRAAAAEEFDPVSLVAKPTYPLDIVEMDTTKTQLFCVDDRHCLPLGRLWATASFDLCTGMPTGAYLGFEPPSTHSVMQCLRNSILPKTWVRERFPEVLNDWPAHGIPYEVHLDQGRENMSDDLIDFCIDAKINIEHGPSGEPRYRGTIERFFKTVNTKLLQHQRGTTFSNVFEKGDYNPAENAVIPFETILRLYYKYLIDRFMRFKVGRRQHIPVVGWLEGCRKMPVRIVSSIADLDLLLGIAEVRTLRRTGIGFENLHYFDPSIISWLSDPKFIDATHERRVKIKIDPGDLSAIRVMDPRTKTYVWMPVDPTEAEYAHSLSLWQHKIIQRYVRERLEAEIDIAALMQAKVDLTAMVEEALGIRRSKISTMQRAARWVGIGRFEPGHPSHIAGKHAKISSVATIQGSRISPVPEEQPKDLDLGDNDDDVYKLL
jgi:putative transposase